ncbi:granzyme-like protein 1 [Anabas testudineus]|uniref:granzyme-like protein 1 n=1 Tax=Anabas testudineus TaxID=64144 RepID=UPI000E45C33D|nr:granzyme-like protein 1 [Anabas testudineus]
MAISIVLLLVFVLNGADGSHIVGGRDAAPHSRPYMASLQVRGQHNCGGALVREDFVLTAAHCQIPVPYRVVLGADSLSGNEPTKQEFTSVKSFPHPNYDGHANDIMLLKLNRRAELNEAVQLISMKAGRLRTRSLCITVGWGDIGDNNTLPSTLQEVNVTTLPQETCYTTQVLVFLPQSARKKPVELETGTGEEFGSAIKGIREIHGCGLLVATMKALHKLLLLLVLTCHGENGHGREIMGKVSEDSMLYMVSVQNDHGHVCGGFLISEDFVVTAAHCDGGKPTSVVLGTHYLHEGVKTAIKQKYKHEAYKNVGKGDDIMLLKLSRKVRLNNRVQTIGLPDCGMNIKENQQCLVAGWGMTTTLGHIVDELRMVNVSVINLDVCKYKWPGLPANVICAGGYGTNKGFCQGDSGGPLVCNGIAVGVVSFNRHMNCNYPDVPNVYTNISKHLYWINYIVRNARLRDSQSCMFCVKKLLL